MIRIRAACRLSAVKADQNKAIAYLKNLGFTGLKLKGDYDDVVTFAYESYDAANLTRQLGVPKGRGNTVSFKVGEQGHVLVDTVRRQVSLMNAVQLAPISTVDDHFKRQEDDPEVSVPNVGTALTLGYPVAQKTPTYRLKFMQHLWSELNRLKFGGKMKAPNLHVRSSSVGRTRASWTGVYRLLEVSPNMFNAGLEVFVEIFLHEMCHQATDELSVLTHDDARDEAAHRGHGRVWAGWMRKVGLNPNRTDKNDKTTYMTPEERENWEADREFNKLARQLKDH
jgi:hypothetical protein